MKHDYFQKLLENGKQAMETFRGFGKDELEENQHWKEPTAPATLTDEEAADKQTEERDIDTFYNNLSYDLMLSCDRDMDGFINFSEYLLVRKGLIAWNQCAQVKMNRIGLKCALTISTPLKTPSQSEVDVVFKLGLEIS